MLDNIKVAVFDFDNTLAIHSDKDYAKKRDLHEDKILEFYSRAYLEPDIFYETIEPCSISKELLNLINYLREKKVKLYCLSGMKYSFQLKAKECFLHKHYGSDIEMLYVSSQKLKADAIKVIGRLNNIFSNEILFVDDLEDNVNDIKSMGVLAYTPVDASRLLDGVND